MITGKIPSVAGLEIILRAYNRHLNPSSDVTQSDVQLGFLLVEQGYIDSSSNIADLPQDIQTLYQMANDANKTRSNT